MLRDGQASRRDLVLDLLLERPTSVRTSSGDKRTRGSEQPPENGIVARCYRGRGVWSTWIGGMLLIELAYLVMITGFVSY